jgi:hypothetical protein
VLLCEEVLEVAPKGLFARGLISGKWVATEVVASLEDCDGVSGGKCGSGGRHFYFLVLCQRSPRIYRLLVVFLLPGSNDNHFLAFFKNVF